ncbi:sensor histidine kinase [Listeria booriae]|uniref:sensor histidine kinase n=1 Tax=Listeria booriae TaxID=1552123 RepID=UPI001628BE1B|nr:GHKL domain-containing protein [Listeria booriae]MBC1285767.1 GHKL domain-containing protein [Listeria booriae]MBC1574751.1 GHKL domain-containing protein [Listeria booriae]MBC1892017.1 GHKL domain-containing protein [Listeria booriae]MBC1913445.1 GHKL domain-containing protein [Listeria booriae]MBC1975455.1 GHKL domain-containing protein [Listeria booriae]
MSIISVAVVFAGFITLDSLAYLSGGLLGSMTSTKIGGYSFITSFIFLVYAFIVLKIIDLILGKVRDDVIFQGKYLLVAVILSSFTVGLFYIYIIQGSEGGAGFTDEKLRANAIIFFVYTIILGIALTIIVKTAVKSAKLEAQALQMRQLQEYVGALEALQKDVRVFRHDYVNILSGINGFITNEDMDGLRVYFRTKVIPMNSDMEVNISKLATLHNLEVVELKGLFATKLIRAQELGVNAQVEVYKKIDQINMDSIDLCRAVGILLDNAIEAVMGTEDPTIRVAIIQKKDAIVLVFANNLPEDSPPVHQFFDEGFSTKGENRGLGLSTLKKTLKKYPNVSLDTKVTQLGFVQELEIG